VFYVFANNSLIDGKILAVDIDKGRTHDFKVFKQSKSTRKITASVVLAYSGYVGIKKLCPNAQLPKKKTKLKALTIEDKKKNHKLSSKRIIVEQINFNRHKDDKILSPRTTTTMANISHCCKHDDELVSNLLEQ